MLRDRHESGRADAGFLIDSLAGLSEAIVRCVAGDGEVAAFGIELAAVLIEHGTKAVAELAGDDGDDAYDGDAAEDEG